MTSVEKFLDEAVEVVKEEGPMVFSEIVRKCDDLSVAAYSIRHKWGIEMDERFSKDDTDRYHLTLEAFDDKEAEE